MPAVCFILSGIQLQFRLQRRDYNPAGQLCLSEAGGVTAAALPPAVSELVSFEVKRTKLVNFNTVSHSGFRWLLLDPIEILFKCSLPVLRC